MKFHKHTPDPVLTMTNNNSVTFICKGDEMLRLSPDGFFVRGKKVKVDDKEALSVYNSFKEWLTWQQLNRG